MSGPGWKMRPESKSEPPPNGSGILKFQRLGGTRTAVSLNGLALNLLRGCTEGVL